MEITRKNISEIAHRMIDFCNYREIKTTEDLKNHPDILYTIPSHCEQSIELTWRPSNNSTNAIALSYIWKGVGVPLETRLNFSLDYIAMILKAQTRIPTYIPFGIDDFNNVIQHKNFQKASYSIFMKELKELEKQEV